MSIYLLYNNAKYWNDSLTICGTIAFSIGVPDFCEHVVECGSVRDKAWFAFRCTGRFQFQLLHPVLLSTSKGPLGAYLREDSPPLSPILGGISNLNEEITRKRVLGT